MVTLPLLVVFSGWLNIDSAVWQHLADNVLGRLLGNTLVLVAGVGGGTLVLGVSLAWLTAMCDFPGRRLFDWALMLPFAVPAYVLAFIAVGLLDFSGPVQSLLRGLLGPGNYWFPSVRSQGGVVLVMTLTFYPYVYMLTRAAFIGQGRSSLEAARVLGLGPWTAFLRVAVPTARPAIAAGLALVLMETLADFGTVAIFNYDTFTTAIYKAWFGLFNLPAAAQLASLLLVVVLLALTLERRGRGRARFDAMGRGRRAQRLRLTGWRAWGAFALCTTVFTLAFAVPVIQLLVWTLERGLEDLDSRYWQLLTHTLTLGILAALLTVAGALVMAYTRRHYPDRWIRPAVRLGTLGYALPGSVLAVGIMISLTWVDNRLAELLGLFGLEAGLVLRSTILALLLAYLVRFMAVAFGPVDSGLDRIRPTLVEAARGMGAGQGEIIRRLYLPLLSPGLLTGLLLVMVDVMKEMPATLLLRPFGWDTFAVRIFEMTSEGEWERAALPALTLVLTGLLPVILLVRRSAGGH
ncbi:MAG: iron ABC transporter permease [Candidatus Competibacteraceae bacterium]|nr:iron ABC transporter permease [Candidatus Competibacteraceae bacterium]